MHIQSPLKAINYWKQPKLSGLMHNRLLARVSKDALLLFQVRSRGFCSAAFLLAAACCFGSSLCRSWCCLSCGARRTFQAVMLLSGSEENWVKGAEGLLEKSLLLSWFVPAHTRLGCPGLCLCPWDPSCGDAVSRNMLNFTMEKPELHRAVGRA